MMGLGWTSEASESPASFDKCGSPRVREGFAQHHTQSEGLSWLQSGAVLTPVEHSDLHSVPLFLGLGKVNNSN